MSPGAEHRIPHHEVVRVLREVRGRCVLQTKRNGVDTVTRVLTRVVLPAHHARSVRDAALVGRGSFASLGDEIAMTLDGYATAARLLPPPGSPPRWTSVIDAGLTEGGYVYITTSWVPGVALHQLDPELQAVDRYRIVRGVLGVLCELHACRVAYGDLKLANVVLREDGGVALIDLDTLREVPGPDGGAPTRDRTEQWAAPEQIERQETWLASDLFAFSRLCHEVFFGNLPPSWQKPLLACRVAQPLARPTAASLRQYVDEGGAGLFDHAGRLIDLDAVVHVAIPVASPAPAPMAGEETERERAQGEATEREPANPETERDPRTPSVETLGGAGENARPPGNVSAWPAAANPGLSRAPGAASPASGGCLGLVSAVGQFAFFGALFAIAAVGLGFFAYNLSRQNAAEAMADEVMARVKIHKTDPARNTDAEQERLAKNAGEAWNKAHTPRTCAVRALTLVWKQHWHYDDDWSPVSFASAKEAIDDPLCGSEPEAALARATLYAGACKRRDPAVPTIEDCAQAIDALAAFWAKVPAGDEWHWLRVEAAWQELRARNALASRFVETKNAESKPHIAKALALCDQALSGWLDYAPVNGIYLVRQCAQVAGLGYDVERYFQFTDRRLAVLPTDTSDRRRALGQLYTAAGPECGDTTLTWRRAGLLVEGAPWCRAVGDAARGCVQSASTLIAENALGDQVHPWSALATALATRSGPCLE